MNLAKPPVSGWKPPPLSALRKEQLPVEIYRKFKKELGEVDSHLCLIDAAIQDLALAQKESPNGAAFLRQRTLEHGHRRLSTDNLDLHFAMRLAYTSQVALLQSRLEQLCRILKRHCLINVKLNEVAEGDFLRRTLWLIAASREDEKLPATIEETIALRYVDSLDLAVLDYYRIMRNLELHAVSDAKGNCSRAAADDNLTGYYSKIDVNRCKSELGYVPTLKGEMSFIDVLIVSKSCQRVARSLCRSIINPQRDVEPELRRKFGSFAADRRLNAAKALMNQTYLLDVADVEALLYSLAW